MNIVVGGFYTIKDEFFEMVNDPYLYRNHPNGGYRPHFLAIYDKDTDLYWMVPCTTQIEKYQHYLNVYNERLNNVRSKKELEKIKKRMLGFAFADIVGRKSVLVFADMFPISSGFIDHAYSLNKNPCVIDQSIATNVLSQAKIVKNMLNNGFKFQRTQPNISRIKKICLSYNSK